MKNQYFGDISDYYKFGLLRLITKHTSLKVGVCWMLTKDDDGNHDKRKKYLCQPKCWQHYDPELYEFLKDCYCHGHDIAKIKDGNILPACQCHPHWKEELRDGTQARKQYFNDVKHLAQSCDLLFFDPDNGMEVKSTPYGRKDSSKYLYWCEARELYDLGCSLLVFQHHRRVEYKKFIESLSDESRKYIGVCPQCYYRTTYATLLVIAQKKKKHEAEFQKLNEELHKENKIQPY